MQRQVVRPTADLFCAQLHEERRFECGCVGQGYLIAAGRSRGGAVTGALNKAKAIAARAKTSITGLKNIYTQHKPVIEQASHRLIRACLACHAVRNVYFHCHCANRWWRMHDWDASLRRSTHALAEQRWGCKVLAFRKIEIPQRRSLCSSLAA